jgi:hypothetical protein
VVLRADPQRAFQPRARAFPVKKLGPSVPSLSYLLSSKKKSKMATTERIFKRKIFGHTLDQLEITEFEKFCKVSSTLEFLSKIPTQYGAVETSTAGSDATIKLSSTSTI